MKVTKFSCGIVFLCLNLFLFNCEKKTDNTNKSNTITDSRDGEVYSIVTIGNQTWLAENLRYNASGSWENPDNPNSSYGRLYNWTTAMNNAPSSSASPSGVQGICPNGWHIPSDSEWDTLELALGMPSSAVNSVGYRGNHETSMKSVIGWRNNTNGTNSSGFNALPAGSYYLLWGGFISLGESCKFWSATQLPNENVWTRLIHSDSIGVLKSNDPTVYGHSCRCVKN